MVSAGAGVVSSSGFRAGSRRRDLHFVSGGMAYPHSQRLEILQPVLHQFCLTEDATGHAGGLTTRGVGAGVAGDSGPLGLGRELPGGGKLELRLDWKDPDT